MSKTILACAFIASAATLCTQAQAQARTPIAGPYIGGSIGSTDYKGPDVGGLSTDRSATGGKIYGGYSFNPNFSLEGGYADLGDANSAAGTTSGDGIYVDAVGTIPLSESFSAIGRVGVFNGKSTDLTGASDRGTSYKYGLGVQYDFTRQVGLRGEWERYRFKSFGDHVDRDMLSVGVNYRF